MPPVSREMARKIALEGLQHAIFIQSIISKERAAADIRKQLQAHRDQPVKAAL